MPQIKLETWMPLKPIDVFFFDCDGTLSLIEGIVELARMNGVADAVQEITQRCMAETGLSLEDYRQRLEYTQPTTGQINEVAALYIKNSAPGAREVMQVLQSLGKKTYILSAGIKTALLPLAQDLNIPPEQVLAVDVYFDDQGRYAGFDEHTDLAQPEGKNKQILKILKNNERSLLLGDGISDWEAHSVVTRFVGFSGLNPKKWVQTHSEFFIANSSFYPLINLGLTHAEQMNLAPKYRHYYEQGLKDLQNGTVSYKGRS